MTNQLRPGDIYRYDSTEHHCRERLAVAVEYRGQLVLMDTYWLTSDSSLRTASGGSDSYFVSGAQLAAADFQFNITDLRPAERYEDLTAYPPGTVYCVTAQHGHVKIYYVTPGTTRSNKVILERERALVAKAHRSVASAVAHAESAERELARLEALDQNGEQL